MKRMKKRREVITLVQPKRTQEFIPIDQADAELREVAIAVLLIGIAIPFVVIPMIGLVFF